jgi:hypothetical protein
LFDDQNFAELFPISGSVESKPPPAEASASNPPEIVNSLFNDGADAANLFDALNNFPVSWQEENSLELPAIQSTSPEAQISAIIGTESAPGAGADNLIDDLDFIDDSEFIPAFGSTSDTASP